MAAELRGAKAIAKSVVLCEYLHNFKDPSNSHLSMV